MFLKGFKRKSNQKFINKLLNNSTQRKDIVELQSIGVLLNYSEFNEFEVFTLLFKELSLSSPKCKVAAFIKDEKQIVSAWNTYFIPEDIGRNGKILSLELESFIETDFDILIGYYNENEVEVNLIAALSKAKFKIGLSQADKRIYHLIINVRTSELNIFKTELTKYLRILKFIK